MSSADSAKMTSAYINKNIFRNSILTQSALYNNKVSSRSLTYTENKNGDKISPYLTLR